MGEKCGKCQYRTRPGECYRCNYFVITGKCRLCPVEQCDKFVEGERIDQDSHPTVARKKDEAVAEAERITEEYKYEKLVKMGLGQDRKWRFYE